MSSSKSQMDKPKIKMRSTDTVWYLKLTAMQRFGIKVSRKWFKDLIKIICDVHHIKRADVGIITGARAEVYFDGVWKSLGIAEIMELAVKGTDLIFIEKRGIIEEITEYADKYGVSLVNSRGYLTEYAHELIEAANAAGANITLITDYDLSGINLASKCDPSVHYITMDDSTLEYFGLAKDERLVVKATNTGLVDTVQDIIQTDSRFAHLDIEFLKQNRTEINAVLAQVGDERFWNFIMEKVGERYPTRNYNRAIKTPSKDQDADEVDLYPKATRKFIRHYRKSVSEIVEDVEEQIQKEQEKVEGFLDVEEQKKKNKERVMKVIAENEDIAEMEARMTELCKSLDIDLSDDEDDEDNNDGANKSKRKRGTGFKTE